MSNIKTVEEMRSLADTSGLCGGTLCWGDLAVEVEILYLSPTGARICLVNSDDAALVGGAVHVVFKIDRFQDLRASIIWQQETILGLQFDGAPSVDQSVGEAPDPGDEADGEDDRDRRSFPRKRVMLAANLDVNGAQFACRILDMSLVGARLQVDEDLPNEELMQLVTTRFGLLPIEVMWRVSDQVGVQYLEPPGTINMILKDFLTE